MVYTVAFVSNQWKNIEMIYYILIKLGIVK